MEIFITFKIWNLVKGQFCTWCKSFKANHTNWFNIYLWLEMTKLNHKVQFFINPHHNKNEIDQQIHNIQNHTNKKLAIFQDWKQLKLNSQCPNLQNFKVLQISDFQTKKRNSYHQITLFHTNAGKFQWNNNCSEW
jgi:tRNA uridine 5-carbamoylmethylation protein Kti12